MLTLLHLFTDFPKVSGGKSFLFLGLFAAAVGASKPLDLISVADIGKCNCCPIFGRTARPNPSLSHAGHFAAQALLQPADYEGRIIALAGDRLSIKELQATYTKVQGRDAWRAYIPSLLLGALPADMNAMLKVSFWVLLGWAVEPGLTKFPTSTVHEEGRVQDRHRVIEERVPRSPLLRRLAATFRLMVVGGQSGSGSMVRYSQQQ